jgi:hypothetical protein
VLKQDYITLELGHLVNLFNLQYQLIYASLARVRKKIS